MLKHLQQGIRLQRSTRAALSTQTCQLYMLNQQQRRKYYQHHRSNQNQRQGGPLHLNLGLAALGVGGLLCLGVANARGGLHQNFGSRMAMADEGSPAEDSKQAEAPVEEQVASPEKSESLPEPVADQDKEAEDESIFVKTNGQEQILNMLSDLENKLVFLKHGIENEEQIAGAENLGEIIASMRKIGVKTY